MLEKDTGNLAVCILLSPRERILDFQEYTLIATQWSHLELSECPWIVSF